MNIAVWPNKELQVPIETPFSGQLKALVRLPNLSGQKPTVSGDWGPIYTFNISPLSPIQISYYLGERNIKTTVLEKRRIQITSPMDIRLRKKFPYQCSFIDEQNNISFNFYLSHAFEFLTAEITSKIQSTANLAG